MISEIGDSAPTALQAIKLLATYLSNEAQRVRPQRRASAPTPEAPSGPLTPVAVPASQPSVLASLEALLSDAAVGNNHTVLLCAASVYAREGNYPEALKACNAVPHLELLALCVQILLAMDRPDVAERSVKQMAALDDDATLTQLAGAWVNLALGGVKLTDAAYTFQELGDKYCWTPKLHCGAAACRMAQGAWDEAEKELMEALTKDGKDTETLANLIVCNLHLGRRGGSKLRTHLAQLRAVAPQHALLAKQAACEAAFDAAAAALG